MQMMMTSDETQIQIFANVTCKTRFKGEQEKSRISRCCRDKETADRQKLSRRKIMVKPCWKWAVYRIIFNIPSMSVYSRMLLVSTVLVLVCTRMMLLVSYSHVTRSYSYVLVYYSFVLVRYSMYSCVVLVKIVWFGTWVERRLDRA